MSRTLISRRGLLGGAGALTASEALARGGLPGHNPRLFTSGGSPPTGLEFLLFDSSCHLFYSTDVGAAWTQTITPSGTESDNWNDMTMAINDEDYSTLVSFDTQLLNFTGTNPAFNGNNGGVEVSTTATLPSAPMINYTNNSTGTMNYIAAFSGAATANGQTMLIAGTAFDGVANQYPRLTTNGGTAWADVTGLPAQTTPATITWLGAAFSQSAAVMYIHAYNDHVRKSTDGGAMWSSLSASPVISTPAADDFSGGGTYRIRSSKNGLVVAVITVIGQFYISIDGGTTWSHTDFFALTGLTGTEIGSADFGMSTDAMTIYVVYSRNTDPGFTPVSSFGWKSTNSGGSWGALTLSTPTSASGQGATVVNCSPDGTAVLIGYASNNLPTGLADISTDGGATLTSKTFTMTPIGGTIGQFCSAYVVPH